MATFDIRGAILQNLGAASASTPALPKASPAASPPAKSFSNQSLSPPILRETPSPTPTQTEERGRGRGRWRGRGRGGGRGGRRQEGGGKSPEKCNSTQTFLIFE